MAWDRQRPFEESLDRGLRAEFVGHPEMDLDQDATRVPVDAVMSVARTRPAPAGVHPHVAASETERLCSLQGRSSNEEVQVGHRTSRRIDVEAVGEDRSLLRDEFDSGTRGTPDEGAKGVSAFMVPMDLKGITTTRCNDLGSKAVGRGSIFFDGVEVPVANRLADEGKGFAQVMQGFDYSRALIGLQCAGAAQASLDETWAYIKERRAFDAPLAQYQGVTFPLAEAETMVAALRQLAFHTLRLKDDGAPHTSEAAMCKWLGPKTAVDVTHQCLLTHGHYGWSLDLPHQQRMRDVMGLEIGDGTAQIMKLVIARERVGRMALQYQKP